MQNKIKIRTRDKMKIKNRPFNLKLFSNKNIDITEMLKNVLESPD